MRIKDIEKNLGISESTVDRLIKKPEGERILRPKKDWKGYYDYSPDEIDWLKKYMVLRIVDIQYAHLLDLESGKKNLATILRERQQLALEKSEKVNRALELCQELLDRKIEYHSFPTDELFDRLRKPIASTASFEYDDSLDTTPINLERTFFCPRCGKRFVIDLADFVFNEYSNEEPMGNEIVYEFDTEGTYACRSCGQVLEIRGLVSEYPIGGFNYERITLAAKLGI